MRSRLHIYTIFLAATIAPFLAIAQAKDGFRIQYIKYSAQGNIISDTTLTVLQYGGFPIYVINNDTVRIGGQPCNCKMLIYQKGKIIEDVANFSDDSASTHINQYSYNSMGKLEQKSSKDFNLPWMTTNYEYNEEGQLKKEFSNNDRYGFYSVDYIFDKDKLIMKITNDNNHIDTLIINPK